MNNNIHRSTKTGKALIAMAAVLIAGTVAATPALADSRRHTTVIRETVYHSPTRVIVEPTVIVPISSSLYLGLGSPVSHHHSHTTVVRQVHSHPGRGHAYGHHKHEPARGRWSGAHPHREVIYVDRNGRRSSSYREAERHSVIIRDRSR